MCQPAFCLLHHASATTTHCTAFYDSFTSPSTKCLLEEEHTTCTQGAHLRTARALPHACRCLLTGALLPLPFPSFCCSLYGWHFYITGKRGILITLLLYLFSFSPHGLTMT